MKSSDVDNLDTPEPDTSTVMCHQCQQVPATLVLEGLLGMTFLCLCCHLEAVRAVQLAWAEAQTRRDRERLGRVL